MCRRTFPVTCLILSLYLAAPALAAAPFQQDSGADGLVSIEAEHYDAKLDVGTNTWALVMTPTGFTGQFSGGQAMQIMPETALGGASRDTGFVGGVSPRLDFQVNFSKTGTYYVWLLAFGRDGNSDSAHAGLDGVFVDTCDRMDGWNNLWRWHNTTMDGPRSTFVIDSVGVHTVNLYMREDGLAFDKVVLTTNANYTPTGNGPAESPRGVPPYATSPAPADGATDVPRDMALAWVGGPHAVSHDVYFGAVLADVNAASRTDPKGVLISQAQDANSYDPAGVLDFGKVYYWRVDEVNAAPDATITRGSIWTFTAETLTYRVTAITATASSSDAGAGPENTINGSGLANNLHSTANTAMWVSSKTGAQPTWIQYAFDQAYKLYEMRVWNYNVVFESVLGFGIKDVTIEYSTDGATWTVLKDTQFAQGTSLDNYMYNTTVNFGGAVAQFVRLTAKSNWGGIVPQFGLSEVRFYYTPVSPRQPSPASGATGVNVDATLSWRAGREAATHDVYFGTDQQAVAGGTAPVQTLTAHSFDPGPLAFGTTYYWKVAEVNEAAMPKVWEGDLWSFSTTESFAADDFESYNDDDNRIYDTWIDGLTNGSRSRISVNATVRERLLVENGR